MNSESKIKLTKHVLDVVSDSQKDEILANFTAITECYDIDIASIYLNENGWNLEVNIDMI